VPAAAGRASSATPTAAPAAGLSGLAGPGLGLLGSPSRQRKELALSAGARTPPRASQQPFEVAAAAVAGGTRQGRLAADLLRAARATAGGLAPAPAALRALAFALTQVSKPYLWGGTGPSAFDCSGLTQQSYAHAGLALPRTAAEQARIGTPVRLADLLPGDLLFYAHDVHDAASIHHVTMYAGNGLVVHAPQTGELVHLSPVWLDEYIGAVRPVPAVAGTGAPGGTPAGILALAARPASTPPTPAPSTGASAPARAPTTPAASGAPATTPGAASPPANDCRTYRWVLAEALPLARREATGLYAALAALLGGDNPTGATSRTPQATEQLTQQLGRLFGEAAGTTHETQATTELRRLLCAPHSVLTLRVVQEALAPLTTQEGDGALPLLPAVTELLTGPTAPTS
jgi:cell wall-associated NlpC family hydrolase